MQYVAVCKMNACMYQAHLLRCHAFGNSIKSNDVLMKQPRAQSGPEHIYCSFATYTSFRIIPAMMINFSTQPCIFAIYMNAEIEL